MVLLSCTEVQKNYWRRVEMKKYKLELEEVKAKHAKELQELELKHSIIQTLEAGSLPIPDRLFCGNSEPWLTYSVDSIKQAVEIVNSFELLRYGIYSNGTTSIKPLIQYNDRELEKIDLKFSCPSLELVKHSFKTRTDNTLIFWSYISDILVFIKIEIKKGVNLIVDIIRDKRGRKIKTEISCPIRKYNHKLQFYYPSDDGADFRLFFNDIKQVEEVFENGNY